MADFDGIISTSPQWVDIPSLSTSAIALGGTAGAGAMNAQAVALAKRTNYLINYSVQISPTTGNAGIGTSSALGRLQIGDYSVDVNNKIVLGKAQASTEGNLPAIGQKSTGVGNDLALASTSASGSVKIFTGTSTNSGEIGTGSNTEKLKIDNSGWVYANGTTSRFVVSPSTPTNNAIFHAQNSSGSAYFGIDNSAGGFTGIAYSLGIWHTGAYPIILGTNNTIRMTIDSTGILNKFVSSSSGAETVAIRFTNGTNNLGSIRSYNSSGLDQHIRLYASAAGTEFLAASIDHQGNFGQGLTPSTNWASGHKAHEIGYSGNYIMSRQSNEINVGAGNTYGKYAVSGAPVSMYSQVSGAHYWNNAASGTIGNTITWSPAMTLTTSGALLVGSSSQVTSEKV
ncbi:MAG TPA: hypothetical protein VFM18_13880, partial [Methanosarcina sp.]|nr:hypothetical protein [Methanosarcina sp.]